MVQQGPLRSLVSDAVDSSRVSADRSPVESALCFAGAQPPWPGEAEQPSAREVPSYDTGLVAERKGVSCAPFHGLSPT